jgi:hypothetical protein
MHPNDLNAKPFMLRTTLRNVGKKQTNQLFHP